MLLNSLCVQSDSDFRVVVCDDASPDDIRSVCESYASQLDLRFHRFDQNLGGVDLAGHWNRCLQFVSDEWILMPGDDDLLDPACIAAFKEAILRSNGVYPLYRGVLNKIDEHGECRSSTSPKPHLTAFEKLEAFIDYQPETVIEYVFSKSRIIQSGGFVSLPLGWCSDNATWIRLAQHGGISGVMGAKVSHRSSLLNISNQSSPDLDLQKISALLQFIQWVVQERDRIGIPAMSFATLLDRLIWKWRVAYASIRSKLSYRDSLHWAEALSALDGCNRYVHLLKMSRFRWEQRGSRSISREGI